jgi:hypothetical protein
MKNSANNYICRYTGIINHNIGPGTFATPFKNCKLDGEVIPSYIFVEVGITVDFLSEKR